MSMIDGFQYLSNVRKVQVENKRKLRSENKFSQKKKIEESHIKSTITVDNELHGGLLQIMNDHSKDIKKKYQQNSFHQLFWNQQMTNLSKYPTQ